MNPLPSGFQLGDHAEAVQARLSQLEAGRFPERLWARDAGLWGDIPERRAVAANRLGWLSLPSVMRERAPELTAFAHALHREGLTHAVLLGMGGSSLAPEVLRLTFGVHAHGLDLTVLDSTSPAAVRAVSRRLDPSRTLFVVSSKSGTTLEVTCFERHFQRWMRDGVGKADAGRHFIAITDPGTPLARLAEQNGYRHVFLNPPDLGGRYSALSCFGLVPAALIGMDVAGMLEFALAEDLASRGDSASGAWPTGWALGAALGELARRGRDKLTLVLGDEVAALGSWIEQLIAESTGKEGTGIVPVAGESLGLPESYGDDRVFVAFSADPLSADVRGALDTLADRGHPVLRWQQRDRLAIGAEFLRWEIATATAGAVLGVDPFDEPNVTEAKQATQAVLDRERLAASPHAIDAPEIKIDVPELLARELAPLLNGRRDPASWAVALLSLAHPGDYFAVLAYLHRTPERHELLERVRLAARGAARLATTLGYGPRFLHSTGQLHKGGPPSGLYLQITAEDGPDVAIPGMAFGFGQLLHAQAAGDYEVLERRGRRVVHLHLGDHPERRLEEIAEAMAAVRV